MADLIDRQALAEKKFQPSECRGLGEGVAYRQGWNDAIDAIVDNEPSVEAEPVRHGRWIKNGTVINCSACRHCSWSYPFEDLVKGFNYCPHCGAKMEVT